jgi:hypothetical protein
MVPTPRKRHPRPPASQSLRLRPRSQRRIDNLRHQGIAAALGELACPHMEPDLAAMVLDSLGLTIADLKKAGADPYDLEALQK